MPSKGYKQTEDHKRKIGLANSVAQKGRKLSEKTRRKIGKSNKGKHFYWKGKKMSKEHKDKMSISGIGKHCKEKCHFWQGGIWHNPYPTDWTKTLRRNIRERDRYTCQLCGREPAIYCHHKDYDKKNCSPDNLTTLCRKCHSKTNINRNYWINYFKIITQ